MATLDVKQSGGSYSTLASALSSAGTGDTISIEGSWTVDDTTNAAISDDNLTIQTDADSKHPGYWDESQNHYRLVETAGAHALVLDGAYTVTIDGLAIEQGTTGASGKSDECFRCVPGTSDAVTIKNTLLQCSSNTEQQDCIYTGYNTSIGTITLENCVLYGAGRGGIHAQNNTNANGYSGTVNVNSCVIWNCGLNSSLELGGIGASGYDSKNWSSFNFNVHNSIVVENDSQTSGADFIEQFSTGSGIVWGVSYSIDSDNSIATVDGGGSGNLASRTATDSTSPGTGDWVIFEDITSSPYDLRIVDNAEDDAQDAHSTDTAEGLTIPSTDIVGTSRPQNTDHDIGAFEIEAAGGPTYTLTAAAGSLTFSGTAATLKASRLLTAAAGSLSISGTAATLTANHTITASAGSLTISGTDATLSLTRLLTASAGSLSINGTAATFKRSLVMAADAGSLTFSGTDATLTKTFVMAADAGSLTISGTAATLTASRVLTAAAGSLTFSGTDATLTKTVVMVAEAGALTFSGTAATFTRSLVMAAEAGALSFSGTVATFTRSLVMAAASGSLTLTGTDVTFDYITGYTLTAEAGSLTFSGTAASLTVSRLLTAAAGSLTFSGTDVTLTKAFLLAAEAGSLTLSGTAASLIASHQMTASAGSLTFSGTDASLDLTRLLTADAGSLTFSGTDAVLVAAFKLAAGAGSLTLTGTAASLDYSGAVFQIYTADVLAQITPLVLIFANIAPNADIMSQPSPAQEVDIG